MASENISQVNANSMPETSNQISLEILEFIKQNATLVAHFDEKDITLFYERHSQLWAHQTPEQKSKKIKFFLENLISVCTKKQIPTMVSLFAKYPEFVNFSEEVLLFILKYIKDANSFNMWLNSDFNPIEYFNKIFIFIKKLFTPEFLKNILEVSKLSDFNLSLIKSLSSSKLDDLFDIEDLHIFFKMEKNYSLFTVIYFYEKIFTFLESCPYLIDQTNIAPSIKKLILQTAIGALKNNNYSLRDYKQLVDFLQNFDQNDPLIETIIKFYFNNLDNFSFFKSLYMFFEKEGLSSLEIKKLFNKIIQEESCLSNIIEDANGYVQTNEKSFEDYFIKAASHYFGKDTRENDKNSGGIYFQKASVEYIYIKFKNALLKKDFSEANKYFELLSTEYIYHMLIDEKYEDDLKSVSQTLTNDEINQWKIKIFEKLILKNSDTYWDKNYCEFIQKFLKNISQPALKKLGESIFKTGIDNMKMCVNNYYVLKLRILLQNKFGELFPASAFLKNNLSRNFSSKIKALYAVSHVKNLLHSISTTSESFENIVLNAHQPTLFYPVKSFCNMPDSFKKDDILNKFIRYAQAVLEKIEFSKEFNIDFMNDFFNKCVNIYSTYTIHNQNEGAKILIETFEEIIDILESAISDIAKESVPQKENFLFDGNSRGI